MCALGDNHRLKDFDKDELTYYGQPHDCLWVKIHEGGHCGGIKFCRVCQFLIDYKNDPIIHSYYNDKINDGTYQWDSLYECSICDAVCIRNETGVMESHVFCGERDGSEDHEWDPINHRNDETSE